MARSDKPITKKLVNKEYKYFGYDIANVIAHQLVEQDNTYSPYIVHDDEKQVVAVAKPTGYRNGQYALYQHDLSSVLEAIDNQYGLNRRANKVLVPCQRYGHWVAHEIDIQPSETGALDITLNEYDPLNEPELNRNLLETICEIVRDIGYQVQRTDHQVSDYPLKQYERNDEDKDVVSCGPIVAKFVTDRVLGQPRPETGRYEYGAPELRQFQADLLTNDKSSHFLPEADRQDLQQEHESEMRRSQHDANNTDNTAYIDADYDWYFAYYLHRVINDQLTNDEAEELERHYDHDEHNWAQAKAEQAYNSATMQSHLQLEQDVKNDYVNLGANRYRLFSDLNADGETPQNRCGINRQ